MSRTRKMIGGLAVVVATAAGIGVNIGFAQAATREPVVIVAGTFVDKLLAPAYDPLAARLKADGYAAYIFPLPGGGMGDIADTSAALASFVKSVRAQTGSAKVNLVGHSQGDVVARYYIKNLGGIDTVDSMISLEGPQKGTYVGNLLAVFGATVCSTACQQMLVGSDFLNQLNSGDDTPGNISYTAIMSLQDAAIQPYRYGFFTHTDNASNVLIQAQCPLRVVDHVGAAYDGTAYSGIRQALAKQSIRLNCLAA
jgi:triacylglycerol lipase